MSGSFRVGRRLISVGAVAALCCCTFSASSSQRPLGCKIRLCCRNRSSTLRSVLMSVSTAAASRDVLSVCRRPWVTGCLEAEYCDWYAFQPCPVHGVLGTGTCLDLKCEQLIRRIHDVGQLRCRTGSRRVSRLRFVYEILPHMDGPPSRAAALREPSAFQDEG